MTDNQETNRKVATIVEATSCTIMDPEKHANGDACVVVRGEKGIAVAVADGMGSHANDHLASFTACALFEKGCRDAFENNRLIDSVLLTQLLKDIDTELRLTRDGRMSCFSAVVWYFDESEVQFVHIGDTRIFLVHAAHDWEQITKDDSKIVFRRSEGKLKTVGGAVQMAEGVCSALGDGGVKCTTGRFAINADDCVVIASDGAYKSSAFEQKMDAVMASRSLEEALQTFITGQTFNDDSTVAVLRFTEKETTLPSIETLCDTIQHLNGLPNHTLLQQIGQVLKENSSRPEKAKDLHRLVKLCTDRPLYLTAEEATLLSTDTRNLYMNLPEDDPCKKEVERLVIALQRYANDVRRFG
jgi:serine/threonine protein phosphatase PrpC